MAHGDGALRTAEREVRAVADQRRLRAGDAARRARYARHALNPLLALYSLHALIAPRPLNALNTLVALRPRVPLLAPERPSGEVARRKREVLDLV